MRPDPRSGPPLGLHQAVRRFTRALTDEALIAVTARLEAMLQACGEEPVFGMDQALAVAWPAGATEAPRREVIWAPEADGREPLLQLSAFDASGRVLLRRTYRPSVRRPAHG